MTKIFMMIRDEKIKKVDVWVKLTISRERGIKDGWIVDGRMG